MSRDGWVRVRRSMTKSCPFGLRAIAARIASSRSSSLSGTAQRCTQIGGVVLAKTHEERSGASEPHAIAALAEVMRERRDHPETAARLTDDVITRGAPGAIVGLLKGPMALQLSAHDGERQILLKASIRRRSLP